jgi:hypothetical protein
MGALGLMVLMVLRSRTFPRAFLLAVLLLAGLVGSTQWATHAAMAVIDVLGSESVARADAEQVQAALTRYAEATRSAADVLMVVAVGLLVWIPTFFRSSRVRATFKCWQGPPQTVEHVQRARGGPRSQ